MGLSWQQGPLSSGAIGVRAGSRRTADILPIQRDVQLLRLDRICGLVSFDADIVSVQLDGYPLHLEPGQSVISHSPDRNLTVDEALPRGKQP